MSYDIAVIGGGPAGLSAAVNARARNKSVLVVSNDYRESPLYRAKQVDNYLGLPGRSGAELLDDFYRHAQETGAAFRTGRVLNILPMEGACYLSIGSEMEEARAVVLCTGVSQGKKTQKQIYFDILDHIRNNLTGSLRVADIAAHFGYNEKYISSLFSSHAGMTMKQYILKAKIDLANFYLSDTNESIATIARMLGFKDSHNFATAYKKIMGLTPSEYRNAFARRLLYHI